MKFLFFIVSVRFNRSGGIIVYKEDSKAKIIYCDADITDAFPLNKLRASVVVQKMLEG